MSTYTFILKDLLGEVKIAAVNRISAEEQFIDMGYSPSDIKDIVKEDYL